MFPTKRRSQGQRPKYQHLSHWLQSSLQTKDTSNIFWNNKHVTWCYAKKWPRQRSKPAKLQGNMSLHTSSISAWHFRKKGDQCGGVLIWWLANPEVISFLLRKLNQLQSRNIIIFNLSSFLVKLYSKCKFWILLTINHIKVLVTIDICKSYQSISHFPASCHRSEFETFTDSKVLTSLAPMSRYQTVLKKALFLSWIVAWDKEQILILTLTHQVNTTEFNDEYIIPP